MGNDGFKKALDKAAEILQFAFDNAHKAVDPEKATEALNQLEALEKTVEEFRALNKQFLEGSRVDDFVLQAMMTDTDSEAITQEQRELLIRAEDLKKHAQAAEKNLREAAKASKESEEAIIKKTGQKASKSRKGKFRSMGGKKNWKPL
jgi:hypothetical protein